MVELSRKALRSNLLSLEAKGLYGYLKAVTDVNGRGLPVKIMIKELGVSKNRFYKYLKELKQLGLVSTERVREETGKYSYLKYTFSEVLI